MEKKGSKQSQAMTLAAEGLGAILGNIVGRIDAWRGQRQQIAKDLNDLISQAQDMLKEVHREPDGAHIGSFAEIAHAPAKSTGGPRGDKMPAAMNAKRGAAAKTRRDVTSRDATKFPSGRKGGRGAKTKAGGVGVGNG